MASFSMPPVPLNATGFRSRLLFYAIPTHLRPTIVQHPLLCPHGKPRVFDIDNATDNYGDVYTWVEVRHEWHQLV